MGTSTSTAFAPYRRFGDNGQTELNDVRAAQETLPSELEASESGCRGKPQIMKMAILAVLTTMVVIGLVFLGVGVHLNSASNEKNADNGFPGSGSNNYTTDIQNETTTATSKIDTGGNRAKETSFQRFISLSYNYRGQEASYSCNASEECRSRAAEMERYMDLSTDPCTDFYQFACGNYQAYVSPGTKGYEDVFWKTTDVLDSRLTNYLESSDATQERSQSRRKARLYYSACNDSDPLADTAALREIARDLGDFQFGDKLMAKSDFNEVLAKALTFTNDAIFLIDIVDTDGNLSFTIGSGYTSIHSSDVCQIWDEWFPSTKGMGQCLNSNVTSDIIDLRLSLINWELSYIGSPKRVSLEELTLNCDMVDWENLLRSIIQSSGVADIDMVFESVKMHLYLKASLSDLRDLNQTLSTQLLSNNGGRAVHNLLVYKAVSNNFPRNETKHTCLTSTAAALPYGLASMIEDEATHKKAADLFGEILKEFKETIETSTHLSSANKEKLKDKLETNQYNIGLPMWVFNDTLLDKYYEKLEVETNSIRNTINSRRFRLGQQLMFIGYPTRHVDWDILEESILEVNSDYQSLEGRLNIFVGLLQQPYFNYNYTDPMLYGIVGTIMGHELNHMFMYDLVQSSFCTDRQTCVADYYSNFHFNGEYHPGYQTYNEDIADINGAKVAFKSLLHLQSREASTDNVLVLPASKRKFTSEQTFFLAFAQGYCSSYTNVGFYDFSMYKNHSPGPYRVNGTLPQIPEFAQAFHCPNPSPMAPLNRCVTI